MLKAGEFLNPIRFILEIRIVRKAIIIVQEKLARAGRALDEIKPQDNWPRDGSFWERFVQPASFFARLCVAWAIHKCSRLPAANVFFLHRE